MRTLDAILGLAPALVLPLVVTGCAASPPPKELIDARAAYAAAQQGPAQKEKPAEVHVARQSLEQAETAFKDDPDAPRTKDLAYIAVRKAQLAEAIARASLTQKERDAALAEILSLESDAAKRAQAELASTKSALEKSKDQLEHEKEALAREKALREAAEKKAAALMADLNRIAAVKQEPRGTVITLAGGVLFRTGESTLLPAAMVQLNQVADAILKGNPDSNITVEGHTDAQGSLKDNEVLSQKRADAVREHLVAHGIAKDRIKAVGRGPSVPVASNDNSEGRANNRRVELIVEPPKK